MAATATSSTPRLRRSDCSGSGIRRVRHGRGFRYLDDAGDAVTEGEVLARIDELVIPPAWRDVWICPYPGGHIQATGTDAAGRKQYLYHPRWRELRDQEKFDDMIVFARTLPRLRRRIDADLRRGDLSFDHVCATAARLLDRGFFRVGGEDYAVRNETYGLATMHKRHVRLRDGVLLFDYPAKHGKRRIQAVIDPEVADVVGRLKRRRGGGPELLAYKRGRRWADVRSADINAWLKQATAEDISAKDFRTWGRRCWRQWPSRSPSRRPGRRRGASAPSPAPSRRWRATSATRPRSRAPPTSIRASWTASATARRSTMPS